MMDTNLTVRQLDGILYITIAREDRLNALDRGTNAELGRLLDEFEHDGSLRVAILTGAGQRAFCSGNDLKQGLTGTDPGLPPSGFGGMTARFERSKPVIAAVNGMAVGGGFELALACDLIIASSGASFSLPEPRIGMAALAGGIQLLLRDLPAKQAMGLLLTGRSIDAAEAYRLGLVNEVTAPEALMDAATRWATEIAACAPLASRATLQVARLSEGLSYATAIREQESWPCVQDLLSSADRQEGLAAFLEKRAPHWQGR